VQVIHSLHVSGPVESADANGATKAMSDSLTFRLLRYISASAETLNFTRAAGQVFVAQSSLSHQIGKLEDAIDVVIFERQQNGLKLTAAGRIIVAFAENALRDWEQAVAMARAVQRNEIPPLRLGFSSFVNAKLLETFRGAYEGMFAGCSIQLLSGDPLLSLQRLDAGQLDCALLPMPIDASRYFVHQIAQAPLVVCMRSDDHLADRPQLNVHEVSPRLSIFRDPELHPSAHSRLVEMFTEVGIPIHLACVARTPSEVQWMVKERYGLALIDQLFPLEAGLVTRPIAGLNWTADTAFVHARKVGHVALPFIERFFRESGPHSQSRKHPIKSALPEQLQLLG
jgi:DNA-binding transcriptional LysR family regulator